MLLAYRILTFLLYPFFIIIIYLRKFYNKEDKLRYKEKIFISEFSSNNFKKKCIWIHGASIGEIKSIFPIVDKLNNNKFNFLITTTTLSAGNLVIKKYKNNSNIQHQYFPLDVKFLIKKFLDVWNPKLVIFVDSEIWPNLILELKKRKIKLALINGRITKKTFGRWFFFSNSAKKIFNSFDLCLASSRDSKKYLKKLNAKNLKYIGNLKFSGSINLNKIQNRNKNILNTTKNWCAVSTHSSEEIFCLKTHMLVKKKYEQLITIIIPRHINRANKIKRICDRFHLSSQILNGEQKILKNKEIIIINSFGMVPKFLKYSKSVLMGKSISEKFKDSGGQNPIEAAKLGCKVYHGSNINNFKEIYKLLNDYKISEIIKNETELSKKIISDLNNSKIYKNKKIKTINNLGNTILRKSLNEINRLSI